MADVTESVASTKTGVQVVEAMSKVLGAVYAILLLQMLFENL